MLNKLKSLQYQFDEVGNIIEVRIAFNDYSGNPNGNLNIALKNDNGDLDTLSPAQLQVIAKEKILDSLSVGTEIEPEVDEVE